MSLVDNGNMGTTMLVQPSGYSNGGMSNGLFGGDGLFSILFLFILLMMCGGFGNGYGNGSNPGTTYIANDVQRGFDQATLNTGINNISNAMCNGFSNVQQSLCNGFAGVNQNMSNGFAQAEISANARQMADMGQQFAIQSAIQNAGYQNAAGVADLKYTVATENCADRNQASQNTQAIITAINQGNQGIMDKLCALELDGVKGQLAQSQRENVNLQNQLNMANMQASQNAQNALITQGFANEVDALYNRLSNCPVPSIPVYGRQPIFTCGNNNSGCGCGMA